MKFKLLTLALMAITFNANATNYGNPLQGSSAEAYAGAAAGAEGGNATGGNSSGGDSDTNILTLPSTTSAVATSGNVAVNCQIITVKSKAKQYLFGLYSKADIADEEARINGVCILFHVATRTGAKSDWQNLIDYAAKTDANLEGIKIQDLVKK